MSAGALDDMERFYPLHVYVCDRCFLVQLRQYVSREEIFTEYAYFSSYADSWVEHMRVYADRITDRLQLDERSLVVEVASNDGYLLQHFVRKGVPVLGIEPAANVARVAVEKGVPTLVEFFGARTATELVARGRPADLICGANVLARTLAPQMRSAGRPRATSSVAVRAPKNSTRVGTPFSTATRATLAAGSIPRTGTPFLTKCWRR